MKLSESKYLKRDIKKRQQEKDRRKIEKEAKLKDTTRDKRGAALSELTQKRQNQKDKKDRLAHKTVSESDSSDDDTDYHKKRRDNSDDDYEDEKIVKKRKRSSSPVKIPTSPKKEKKEISLSDLEVIRLSRKTLEMLCGHDIFAKTVTGCYVRINTAQAAKQQAQSYIVAKIIDVRDYHKYYKMDEKETNKVLALQYGKKEFQMKMLFVSNSEFVINEFREWQIALQKAGIPLPTVKDIQAKAADLKKGLNYRYSSEDITKKVNLKIEEKLKKGEKLTPYEISILEERANEHELEHVRSGGKNIDLKHKAEEIREKIKKSKSLPGNTPVKPKPAEKEHSQQIKENENMEIEYSNDYDRYNEDQEDRKEEDDSQYWKSRKNDFHQQKTMSQSEYNEELRREFKKMHNISLNIDSLIDEWQIETDKERVN